MRNILPFFVVVALASFMASAQDTKGSRFAHPVTPQQAAALKREEDAALQQAEAAVREMQAVARTEPEKQLANADFQIVAKIRSLVLQRQAQRTTSGNQIAGGSSDGSNALMSATQQMQETQMSFNLQYLQLQNQMQNENRQYTAVSNIMKTKHDTVKNSISNIR
jgi:hypothetical protein